MLRGRHVAPHRLVDAEAGRASARERARVARHVAGCARCADARERLVHARAAMADIAAQPAPELGWDHIGVRVYWSTSSARHKALRRREQAWWRRRPVFALVVTAGVAAATGFALTMWSAPGGWRGAGEEPGERPVASAPAAVQPRRAASPAAPALRGVVTFASGAVAADGAPARPLSSDADTTALFGSAIVQGARLRTADGRLVVQFGPSSGFALAPHSSVVVRRFDDRAVELAVEEGAIEVDVAHRRADQIFWVATGSHRVSVVGTAFQVARRAGGLDVECARGRVLVSDGHSEVAVAAGEELEVQERSPLARALPRAIAPTRLVALERGLARPLLPAWIDSPALFDTSSTLELAAPGGRGVRVDAVMLGTGSFAVRVMPGRHHIEVADAAGVFQHGTWIEARPRGRQVARAGRDGVVVVDVNLSGAVGAGVAPGDGTGAGVPAAAAEQRAARRLRRTQLGRTLRGSARARECVSSLEKRDLVAGATVLFDIGINADGSQGHLNVVRSNVPHDVERCLRAVVDEVELPRGPAATIHFKLAF